MDHRSAPGSSSLGRGCMAASAGGRKRRSENPAVHSREALAGWPGLSEAVELRIHMGYSRAAGEGGTGSVLASATRAFLLRPLGNFQSPCRRLAR